ncbi:MAG: DUF1844 domain-containing protein [Deltaproteobacteria bacterium]|nr:DUF1844 domain-containing protein [Deltaproteobacteria bacterium]
MSAPDEEDKGFKVTDRRVSAQPEDEADAPEAISADEQEFDEAAAKASGVAAPPADFNTLVLSLSTSALMYLGMIAGPDGEPSPTNLPLARHSIDLLAMLDEKTRGNLSGEEETLLGQVLYDLRMHFVTATKS